MNILKNFIKKIIGANYISRALIGEAIVKAQEREAKRINKIRDEQERQNIEKIIVEHEIECESLKAEIVRLNKILHDNANKMNEVNANYYQNKRDAKRNTLIVAEMEHKGHELMKNLGEFIGGIKGIGTKARQHFKSIENRK